MTKTMEGETYNMMQVQKLVVQDYCLYTPPKESRDNPAARSRCAQQLQLAISETLDPRLL